MRADARRARQARQRHPGRSGAALLEVLDPEQNGSFTDNYLGVPFDLSEVMFLATVNLIDSVPAALRDRVEVIQLPGYTEDEKDRIASRFLVPRELAANGLTDAQCALGEGTVRALIHGYTREAGVRNLEREIGRVFRHAAMQVAEGSATRSTSAPAISKASSAPPNTRARSRCATTCPGSRPSRVDADRRRHPVHRASMTPGSGKLILTGQLGEVMKESAQAALTLVKAEAAKIPAGCANFDRSDVHVHVRPVRSRKTVPAPASRCSSRWCRWCAKRRCAPTAR